MADEGVVMFEDKPDVAMAKYSMGDANTEKLNDLPSYSSEIFAPVSGAQTESLDSQSRGTELQSINDMEEGVWGNEEIVSNSMQTDIIIGDIVCCLGLTGSVVFFFGMMFLMYKHFEN